MPPSAHPPTAKSPGKGMACFPLAAILLWAALLMAPLIGSAQQETDYEEVLVQLNVARIGSLELPALIQGEQAYMNAKELFDFLKIKAALSPEMDSLSGFVIDPKAVFLLDKKNHRVIYQDKIYELGQHEMISTETGLYLKSDYFGKIFGLDCSFNFRDLAMTMSTKLELPILRELNMELMHRNLAQLKGEKKADTIIGRNPTLFHWGVADWAVTATQSNEGTPYVKGSLTLGGLVAGGEADAYLNYFSHASINLNQQFFQWHYVNNEQPLFRQVMLGRMFTPSISSIYAPLTGIQVTNAPTTYRRSFGSYRITNTTEPGWTVELYVNNVLINYAKADASGFYSFDVPLVYGSSQVKLRFYGPWGEERTQEQTVNIPFNFLPRNQWEYTASGGVVGDGQLSRFSRLNIQYGLSQRLTVGAGTEYLSSLPTGKVMPFISASIRLLHNLVFSGEHDYGIRTKGTLDFKTPGNMQLEMNWINYQKGQMAIKTNYLQERSATLSFPLVTRKLNLFSRLGYNQFILPKYRYGSFEWMLSAAIPKLSANLTTSMITSPLKTPEMYSRFSLTYFLHNGVQLIPQIQYGYQQGGLQNTKLELQKNLAGRGMVSLSYEKGPEAHSGSWTLGLRMNFSGVSTSLWASHHQSVHTFTESASGSIIHDGKTHYTYTKSNQSVGKGGITIAPFLDLNCNGKRERGEPDVPGLKMRVNGGRVVQEEDKALIRILDLEAYTNYLIELDPASFDNIAWQIKNKTIRVSIEPNEMKLVQVPVAVVGEVSGMVYLNTPKGLVGLSRMIVQVYTTDSGFVGKTLTESDGFFSYMGLAPGNYVVRLDSAQLNLLHMKVDHASLSFSIASSQEGVVSDGFEFKLTDLSGKQDPEIAADKASTYSAVPSKVNQKLKAPVLQPTRDSSFSELLPQKTSHQQSHIIKSSVTSTGKTEPVTPRSYSHAMRPRHMVQKVGPLPQKEKTQKLLRKKNTQRQKRNPFSGQLQLRDRLEQLLQRNKNLYRGTEQARAKKRLYLLAHTYEVTDM